MAWHRNLNGVGLLDWLQKMFYPILNSLVDDGGQAFHFQSRRTGTNDQICEVQKERIGKVSHMVSKHLKHV
jgi:hypothetical protein